MNTNTGVANMSGSNTGNRPASGVSRFIRERARIVTTVSAATPRNQTTSPSSRFVGEALLIGASQVTGLIVPVTLSDRLARGRIAQATWVQPPKADSGLERFHRRAQLRLNTRPLAGS